MSMLNYCWVKDCVFFSSTAFATLGSFWDHEAVDEMPHFQIQIIFTYHMVGKFCLIESSPKNVPIYTGWWFQPLWKIWKSVGIIIPSIWKNNPNVPNHQPDMYLPPKSLIHISWFIPIYLWKKQIMFQTTNQKCIFRNLSYIVDKYLQEQYILVDTYSNL